MHMLFQRWATIIWLLIEMINMASSKPLPLPCIEADTVDILGLSLAETVVPTGVEIIKENGVNGYRFDVESRLLGVSAAEILTRCQYFPIEFSLVVTFRREVPKNDNEYILTLLGQDRKTIFIGVRLQREMLHFDYHVRNGQIRSVAYKNTRLADGGWHTAVITVTRNHVKFTLSCMQSSTSELRHSFPRKLIVKGSRFHVASRRRKRNRFSGMLRQVKLMLGADASNYLCSSAYEHNPSWIESSLSSNKNFPTGNLPNINNDTRGKTFCGDENIGQLMYHKSNRVLEMCEDHRWKRLSTTHEKLDYLVDFGDVLTKSKPLDIEIFEISGEGIFLATANQGRDRNMDSSIYKWSNDDKKFVTFQSITTDIARSWKYFKIENQHFLAVANHGSNEHGEVHSAIYRWNRKRRKFLLKQNIRTFSARSWESFIINGDHYLVIANYASDKSHTQRSYVYKWNSDHSTFISYQTFGATDWEYFQISGRHFLAVANYYDHELTDNRYVVDSSVYEFLPEINQFIKLQDIKTQGALDMEFFTVGKDSFLIASSTSDNNEKLNSVIYRWQGIENFVPVHTFSTSPCADWESFRTKEGDQFLVSANINSRISKILQIITF
ncbi:thrombospondin-type laminin G domain and EAR repeat-containing protein-like isoform X2 [Clavelina lepadiformis]|uniref:Thrombospondin-like N-terminal domain-containing protein n=1 Tax=Clavelina lepadiformis TaxID=159417 RepID=A0ABP0F301_CLALP